MSTIAATAAEPAASTQVVPTTIVEVEEDPSMKEQLADQAEKASEIATLRADLASVFAEHPDASLVRDFQTDDRLVYKFLKARKFDIAKSVKLFNEALAMRTENNLDGVLERPCPKGLEYKLVSYHGWHGHDKYGRPIFIKNTGFQNYPAMFATGEVKERITFNMYTSEYNRLVILPNANARIGHKYLIDQSVTIVNLKNFGFHCIKSYNYDWVKQMAAFSNILYPESQGITFIINAPRAFTMVWAIVKAWLDERTKSKIQIHSSNGKEDLIKALGEEAYRGLPAEIGGDCTCIPDAADVPQHAGGCMIGHEMSRNFIQHLADLNTASGIPNVYTPKPKTSAAADVTDSTQ